VPLPSGSLILVYPPEWDGCPGRRRPSEDIIYFMEVRSSSGSAYIYSRDRDSSAGDFPDFNSFCEELVRNGYASPGDAAAVIEFLERDPESVSLAASVMLT
jgi:hypothetical protein